MKNIIPMVLLAAAYQSEEGVKVYNRIPEATIVSHGSGEDFLSEYELRFQANMSDGNHSAAELNVAWTNTGWAVERLDDSVDEIRKISCGMLKSFLLCASPECYRGTMIDYTLDQLFVHLDDPDASIQAAVYDKLVG